MAIRTPLSNNQLIEKCEELEIDIDDIPFSKNRKRLYGEDYIWAIRNYYLAEMDNIPKHLKYILNVDSVMLADRLDGYNQEFIDEVYDSEEYDFELKMNGARVTLVKADGVFGLYSRHNSRHTCLPMELGNKILPLVEADLNKINELIPYDFILDGEMTLPEESIDSMKSSKNLDKDSTELAAIVALMNSTVERALDIQRTSETRVQFTLWDCILYKGKDIRPLELKKRRRALRIIMEALEELLPIVEIERCSGTREEKENYLSDIVANGGEGVVAKYLEAPYRSDGNRDWTSVKIKPTAKERFKLAMQNADEDDILDSHEGGIGALLGEDELKDTIDGWITGFVDGTGNFEGLVGSFEVTTFVNDGLSRYEHVIAYISGIDMELRKDMTYNPDKYLNRCVEIDGQSISSKSLRLNHARFVRFRDDKPMNECEIPERLLEIR